MRTIDNNLKLRLVYNDEDVNKIKLQVDRQQVQLYLSEEGQKRTLVPLF